MPTLTLDLHFTLFRDFYNSFQARIQKIFKGRVEEENFERKMFLDTCTRINACTHKN